MNFDDEPVVMLLMQSLFDLFLGCEGLQLRVGMSLVDLGLYRKDQSA